MRQYELTYLISDKVGDNDLTAATGKINGIIAHHGGKVLGEDNWGRRKLAYPINKQEFATYVTLDIELEPEELIKINRELRLSKEIIRSLVIVKDYGKEELKLTADEVAETQDIEEVIGGERSFEAVEGETEESYALMAKRDDDKGDEDETSLPNTDEDTVEKGTEELKDTSTSLSAGSETEEQESTEKTEEEAVSTEEKAKPKKSTTRKNTTSEKATPEAKEEVADIKAEKKPAKKKVIKKEDAVSAAPEVDEKKKKAEDEADRLAKLDEEIEGILGDDL